MKARAFAIKAHGNQKYGNRPYIYHLEAVVNILEKYSEEAKVIGYLHDVVEDTKVTLTEIEKIFGNFIAACINILSDEPGENRKERKIKTYEKMSKVTGKETLALIVKAADRLANVEECIKNKQHTLLKMYKKEHKDFYDAVYRKELCEDIWTELNTIIKKSIQKGK